MVFNIGAGVSVGAGVGVGVVSPVTSKLMFEVLEDCPCTQKGSTKIKTIINIFSLKYFIN